RCAETIPAFIRQQGLDPHDPLDILLNRFCRPTNCLFAAKVSLVQHTARGTAAVGGFHRSPTYEKVWMPGPALAKHFQGLAARAVRASGPRIAFKTKRGIVICAGGPRYLPCAWVCIKMLRHVGCELPIEIWHLGPAELPDEMRAQF